MDGVCGSCLCSKENKYRRWSQKGSALHRDVADHALILEDSAGYLEGNAMDCRHAGQLRKWLGVSQESGGRWGWLWLGAIGERQMLLDYLSLRDDWNCWFFWCGPFKERRRKEGCKCLPKVIGWDRWKERGRVDVPVRETMKWEWMRRGNQVFIWDMLRLRSS